MRDIADWFRYKLVKKLRKRRAQCAVPDGRGAGAGAGHVRGAHAERCSERRTAEGGLCRSGAGGSRRYRRDLRAGHARGTATLARGSNFDPASVQTVALIDSRGLDAHIPGELNIVVKVDVEGHEKVVIAELLRSRHAARFAAVFHEVDNRWSEAGSLRDMLAEAGFSGFVRHGFGRHYDILATR